MSEKISLKRANKLYTSYCGWHSRVKRHAKKHIHKAVRTRMKQELGKEQKNDE